MPQQQEAKIEYDQHDIAIIRDTMGNVWMSERDLPAYWSPISTVIVRRVGEKFGSSTLPEIVAEFGAVNQI